MQTIWKFLFFRLAGWSISNDVPRHLEKYLIIVAPHTSNWDFIIGLFVRAILKFKSGFLAKKELFVFPFGYLFRALGGYAVDRKAKHNLVEQVVEMIAKEKRFVLTITPEGTRKKVTKWKTGFYHIAHRANIPIVLAAIDYPKKNVKFSEPIFVTGNALEDVLLINNYFRDVAGKNRNTAVLILPNQSS